jgi:hypothetical protein
MGKSRKRTKRGQHYQTMAAGYQILRSPLAASYDAAAEHYDESDLPHDPAADAHAGPKLRAAPILEPGNGRD